MLLQLDPHSGLPLYRQMWQQIQKRIMGGQLVPGSQLPSARELSAQLKVNFLTVAKVYQLLENQGLVEVRRGLGTFVSARPQMISNEEKMGLIRPLAEELVRSAQQLGLADGQVREMIEEQLKQKKERL